LATNIDVYFCDPQSVNKRPIVPLYR
jgi:hypothetical protein